MNFTPQASLAERATAWCTAFDSEGKHISGRRNDTFRWLLVKYPDDTKCSRHDGKAYM